MIATTSIKMGCGNVNMTTSGVLSLPARVNSINRISQINVTASTNNLDFTLLAPTTWAGQIMYISNTGANPFTMYNQTILPSTMRLLVWNTISWVVDTVNTIGKVAPLISAQVGTQLDFGEITFRYNSNAVNGNMEVRSRTSSTLPITWYAYKQQPASTLPSSPGNMGTPIINANTGLFTTINASGLGLNEVLTYQIITDNNFYIANLASRGNNICMSITKAI